jgi:hypothetical protein
MAGKDGEGTGFFGASEAGQLPLREEKSFGNNRPIADIRSAQL